MTAPRIEDPSFVVDSQTEKRFWSFVEHDPNSGCWLWSGGTDSQGYGAFSFQGRQYKAHRLSWFLAFKAWPDHLACHHCDTPQCVNHGHLFDGTHHDNALDRTTKGRSNAARGTDRPEAKLNDEAVRWARLEKSKGAKSAAIAAHLGVNPHVLNMAIRGKTWKHVPGAVSLAPQTPRGSTVVTAKLTETDAAWIKRHPKHPLHAAALRFGVSKSCISSVRSGKTWAHVK